MLSSSESLATYNTLGLKQHCHSLIKLCSTHAILDFCQSFEYQSRPLLVLGGGSNIVLTDDFAGLVMKIESKGIKIIEDADYYYLSVEAGESWPALVAMTIDNGINGLENLALIPGTAGAAPIQNIGAYGVEFEQVCDWVEYYHLDDKTLNRITAHECHFSYRDSIFKQELKNKTVITRIGLKLRKQWQPTMTYGPLRDLASEQITAKQIFHRVCEIRKNKLPDPELIGNVGSFFKNPIVSNEHYHRLLKQHPGLVAYVMDECMKLAAGWLVDQAGLKGYCAGRVGVHNQQALVLVNHGDATGKDITQLASYVADKVFDMFGVKLEVEPRFIGKNGEIEFNG